MMISAPTAAPAATAAAAPFHQVAIIDRFQDRVALTVSASAGPAAGYDSLDAAIAGARLVTVGAKPAVVIWKDEQERFVLSGITFHAPGSPISRGYSGPYRVGMVNSTPGDPDGSTINGPEPKQPVLLTKMRQYPDDLDFTAKAALAVVDGNWALLN